MKILEDGFKVIEDTDREDEAVYAMNENTVLLHKQMEQLKAENKGLKKAVYCLAQMTLSSCAKDYDYFMDEFFKEGEPW